VSYIPTGKERTQELERLGRWVKETCDTFGAALHTGYLVAGAFIQGLAAEWEKRDAEGQVPA